MLESSASWCAGFLTGAVWQQGVAVAGYGFGAIFTSFPIDSMIKSAGYAHTLVVWGIIQGVIGIIAAQWLRIPPEGWQPAGYTPCLGHNNANLSVGFTPAEMLKTPTFWLLFLMMSMMSTSGLMVVSNVGPFAKEYNVAQRVGVRNGGATAVADTLAFHQWIDAALLRFGL